MTDLNEFELEEAHDKKLKADLRRLQIALDREKKEKTEYHKAVYDAATEAFQSFDLERVKAPRKSRSKNQPLVAVPLVGDTQLGKITFKDNESTDLDYSTQKCLERVEAYTERVIELTEMHRTANPVHTCVVPMLGDIVEGVDIFDSQVWLVDSGLFRQVVVAAEMLTKMFRRLLEVFPEVKAYGIIGNHGRVGTRNVVDPETNMDRMVYHIVSIAFQNEPRISFTIPQGAQSKNWYSIVEIGNYRALAMHGDQFRGGGATGIPVASIYRKTLGWAGGGLDEDFKDVFAGHWHQRACVPVNKRDVYINGSSESSNDFASQVLAAQSNPAWWMLMVDPEAGEVVASHGVGLL